MSGSGFDKKWVKIGLRLLGAFISFSVVIAFVLFVSILAMSLENNIYIIILLIGAFVILVLTPYNVFSQVPRLFKGDRGGNKKTDEGRNERE